jgi:hypothetical protein
MKFLKEEEIVKTSKDGKISITLNQLSTSIQGTVLSRSKIADLESQISLCQFLLKTAIKKVEINGVEYPPVDVADKSDLKDKDTLTTFITILGLALDGISLPEEDKKKSSQQQSPIEQEKSAESAQGATEDTPQTSV